MEKLVWEYSWGGEGCSGVSTIPFEYSSKDDFVLHVLDRVSEARDRERFLITILGVEVWHTDAENIEQDVYTLEEWFEREKRELYE